MLTPLSQKCGEKQWGSAFKVGPHNPPFNKVGRGVPTMMTSWDDSSLTQVWLIWLKFVDEKHSGSESCHQKRMLRKENYTK